MHSPGNRQEGQQPHAGADDRLTALVAHDAGNRTLGNDLQTLSGEPLTRREHELPRPDEVAPIWYPDLCASSV